jgi:hypothetical protein
MTKSIESLEDEYDNLDIPMVFVDAMLEVIGDLFDIDPVEFINSAMNPAAMKDMKLRHGEKEVEAMEFILWEGVESSTQIPHIRRGIGIHREIAKLED